MNNIKSLLAAIVYPELYMVRYYNGDMYYCEDGVYSFKEPGSAPLKRAGLFEQMVYATLHGEIFMAFRQDDVANRLVKK